MSANMVGTLRIGHGYDVHAFAPDRKLILGGVEIPHTQGLLGHSDADVLAHALADAILGAVRGGDIGKLFPDDDPAYEQEIPATGEHTFVDKLVDADCTVAAQAPKLAPYREKMRVRLARACSVDTSQVGVKATTTERLGFVGREEGIAAWAVVLMQAI